MSVKEIFLKRFSEKQYHSIVTSNSKLNFWIGSIRSGKTYASLFRFVLECSNGPKGNFALICRTFDSFKRNVLPVLDLLIPDSYAWSAGTRILNIYNRQIFVIGADDERAERKIRGATFSGAYIDECTVIPEAFYTMLLSRLSVEGSKLFATTNPDTPFHWLKKRLDEDPLANIYHFTLKDNPNLSQETINFYEAQYTGLWKKRFIDGLWVLAEGCVFDFFSDDNVVKTFPNPQYNIVGIDYGTLNPCAFVMIGVNESKYPNWTVIDECYWDSKKEQRQKTDVEYAEDFIKFVNGRGVRSVYIDPSAASFRLELMRQGVKGIKEADNDVENGIRFVSTALVNGRLKVYKECHNLIKEFHSYVWDTKMAERGIDAPLKKHDHLLDSLRYCIFSHFGAGSDPGAHERCLNAWQKVSGQSNLPRIFRDI